MSKCELIRQEDDVEKTFDDKTALALTVVLSQNLMNFRELTISDHMLSQGMLSVLAAGIENNKFLTKLKLQNNFIDDWGLSKLIIGLKANLSISHLDLSQNRIKDKGIEQLCAFIKFNGSQLQRLIVSQNLIETDYFGELLAKYIYRFKLWKILRPNVFSVLGTSN